jgi:mannose-6-phosphate isomerase class I
MNSMKRSRIADFDLNPFLNVEGTNSVKGYEGIKQELEKVINEKRDNDNFILVLDYYYGIDGKKIFGQIISELKADLLIDMDDLKLPESVLYEKVKTFINVHGEAGKFCPFGIDEYFDEQKVAEAKEKIAASNGLAIVFGVAAGIVSRGDKLVYCNLDPNDVLQKRFEEGMDNWGVENCDDDVSQKLKRFRSMLLRPLEWHKKNLLNEIDFMFDGNQADDPVMITGSDFRKVMESYLKTPFKMVPYFMPGVWGGHWCKDVLGADESMVNSAWAIIGIVDFQSVLAKCGDNLVRFPARDILLYKPIELVGHQVFYWFGYACPITMDYLDTWGGGNLSLQVHPTIAYNHETYNYPFAHNESYYVMDANEESTIYLGTKTGVKKDELVAAFKEAQRTGKFDDEKYINRWPVKKHDHVFIPSGTIHCSGKNTCVLEIDMTGDVTLKLWDWARLDLNGKPRPIAIDHGSQVIQEYRQTEYVRENLISKRLEVDKGDGWRKEHSGTMEYEMLTVDRYWFTKTLFFETKDLVKMYCLVEGAEAIFESPNGEFEPVILHYAEAILVPATIGQYTIKPHGDSVGKEIAVLEAYMNFGQPV